MDITVFPGKLRGSVAAVSSKSHAHRLLICAAFADRQTELICPDSNNDIEATAACLRAIGADIQRIHTRYRITPVAHAPEKATLPCGESGSTLRFLLPVVGALGIETDFIMKGRLSQRPLSPLWEEMERHGCRLEWTAENRLRCGGKLRCGSYQMAGNVSSQFISGLLMAFPLMDGECALEITGKVGSKPYIAMTKQVLALFGIKTTAHKHYRTPGLLEAEGDWSSAAFFLGANALGNDILLTGLTRDSVQGDKAICPLINQLEHHTQIDVEDIPDLVPVLSVIAAAKQGAVFTNIQRLRLKESDRVAAIAHMLRKLGVYAESTETTLKVYPGSFTGGIVDSCGDHRIAMAAAVAATAAKGPVTILGAQCADKSYPRFWEDYESLGGHYELNLR